MRENINPYQPGKIPSDKEHFFGRRDLVTWLEQHIITQRRVMILYGPALIGKTTFFHFLPDMLAQRNLMLKVSFFELDDYAISSVLHYIWKALKPQLAEYNLSLADEAASSADLFATIDNVLAQLHQHIPDKDFLLLIDDFDKLLVPAQDEKNYFLDVCQSLLSRHAQLHFIFSISTTSLPHFGHALLDTAPTQLVPVLSPTDALQMITRPLEGIIRFDYGVPKRIAELNSNHPYYLALFNHTLFNRYAREGWINLRHLDETVDEVLQQDIPSFQTLWDEASRVERAVLAAMASVRGTHGVFARQEVIPLLSKDKHAKQADGQVIITALESLSYRGVLVKMGALSYKFHVDLFRFWVQRRFDLAATLDRVQWQNPAARSRPITPLEANSALQGQAQPPKKRPKWIWATVFVVLLCFSTFFISGLAVAGTYIFGSTPSPETNIVQNNDAAVVNYNTEIITPTLTPTVAPTLPPTPTPPVVVAKSLPSVAYMARQGDAPWQIYLMDADGANSQRVTQTDSNEMSPVWSPLGNKLAFVSQRDGNREVYVMDLDGQNALNLSTHPADDWTPAWSPDGTQVAFSSNRQGNWEIFVVNADGSDFRQLTDTGNGNISPVWSPDGQNLVFSSKRDGNWEIYRMRTNGTDVRRLTENEGNDLGPIWSPTGENIVYETNIDGNVEIYVIGSTGGEPRNITQNPLANDHGPVWTPDGQTVIFYSNREGSWDIYSMDLNGNNLANLTNTPTTDEQTPIWRP